jgi:hypothetical protein
MSEAKYIFIAAMDVAADKEDLFNEVYDTEHVPSLLQVPGVLSVKRYKSEPFKVAMGGEVRDVALDDRPRYYAVYELTDADVICSDAWADAVEAGRWPEGVRPHTLNRQHSLQRIL